MTNFKIYKVGGYVRDKLLGIENSDTDYVVVGATIDDMLKLGFIPVGRDFPVFLHPKTHEEYALARKERKNGIGYKGFEFYTGTNVTLKEDLKRRDITINAMAIDENDNIIDPFNGQYDLEHKIIRHVSDAFAEDPLRILRVARFSAKLDFDIAPETFNLMVHIANNKNELLSLSHERIFLELSKALNNSRINVFFKILHNCGALQHILNEFNILFETPEIYNKLNTIFDIINSGVSLSLNEKLAIIYYIIGCKLPINDAINIIRKSLLPSYAQKLAILLIKLYSILSQFCELIQQENNNHSTAITILDTINQLDPIRQNIRFENFCTLTRLIATAEDNTKTLEISLAHINYIIYMFKQIDFNKIFENNNDNKKEIVYNTKLDIIFNFITGQKNA